MNKKYNDKDPSHNMAYLIEHEDDPILADLSDSEIERLAIGRMPVRCINGIGRFISVYNDELIAKMRRGWKPKRNQS